MKQKIKMETTNTIVGFTKESLERASALSGFVSANYPEYSSRVRKHNRSAVIRKALDLGLAILEKESNDA